MSGETLVWLPREAVGGAPTLAVIKAPLTKALGSLVL